MDEEDAEGSWAAAAATRRRREPELDVEPLEESLEARRLGAGWRREEDEEEEEA